MCAMWYIWTRGTEMWEGWKVTNGPIHNRGKGCGKGQWCVANISHINLSTLFPLLEIYLNKRSAKILQDGFLEGFRFGYMGKGSVGSRIIWNLSLICRTKSWRNWTRTLNWRELWALFLQNLCLTLLSHQLA